MSANEPVSHLSENELRCRQQAADARPGRAAGGHYNVAVRLGAAARALAAERAIVFSPWHPGAVPGGADGSPFRLVIDPIAAKYDATRQQIALAWQLHRTPNALPIPGTTSARHLQENLAAAHIRLTEEEVEAITALALEEG